MVYPARVKNVFCSSCSQQIVIVRSVKLGPFFHSSQQLNYLGVSNPSVSNALYGSILLFVLSSFKFLSKLSASRDAKIPNKLLMPYNCTLLSFHSSSLILKARVFFLSCHSNPETQFFAMLLWKRFTTSFTRLSHICLRSAGDLERCSCFLNTWFSL